MHPASTHHAAAEPLWHSAGVFRSSLFTPCLLKSGAPNNVKGSGFLFPKAAYRADFSPSAVTTLPLGFAASIPWKAHTSSYRDLRAIDFIKSRLFKLFQFGPNAASEVMTILGHSKAWVLLLISFLTISYFVYQSFFFLYWLFLLITDSNT